jgi:hypothetical protein
MTFLAVMTVLALYLPNRPTYSDLEQRELTKFPQFTVGGLLTGEYFENINLWFADTFPMREELLALHSSMEEHYGLQTQKVVGDVVAGDDIPDTNTSSDKTETDKTEEKTEQEPEESKSDTSETEDPKQEESEQSEESKQEETPDQETQVDVPKDDVVSEDEAVNDMTTLGALLVIKNAAYEYYNFVQDSADTYISVINRAADKLKGTAKVYNIIVPTSMDICVPEKARKQINTSDQRAAINYLYAGMSDDVTTVEIMDTLLQREQEGDYLYFRTDHHWTALGAYYAYAAYAPLAGKTAAALEDFDEYVYEGFTGSFYRETESAAMKAHPDTIYAFGPKATNSITITLEDGSTLNHKIINDGDKLPDTQKYLTFIGGDNPVSVMENPDIQDGSAVLLIKESFGNCFAPYLVQNYQYVYVIDYRYVKKAESRSLTEFVQQNSIQDVIFLNNISVTREDSLISKISAFVG